MSDGITHRNTLRLRLIVTLIILLAAGLRFYRLGYQSLWYDEGNSAAMVGRSPAQIAQAAAGDIHPPLYYMILAGWGLAAGKSEITLRLPSALAGVMTVAVVYWLGRKLFGRLSAVLAGLLATVSAFQVYYGQEARMYALMAFLSAASVMMTVGVLQLPAEMVAGRFNPRRGAGIVAGYVLVNAAGLYTHYTFPFVIVAETLIFLIWLIRRRSKLHGLVIWAGLQIATLLLFVPWLPTAIHQIEGWPRLTSGVVDALTVLRTLFYGITLTPAEASTGLLALGLTLLIGLIPPAGRKEGYSALYFGERIGLVVAWCVIPLILSMSQGAIREPTLKFLLPCNLALTLLIARGAANALVLTGPAPGSPIGRSLVARLLAPMLLLVGLAPGVTGLQNLYFNPIYARDDYRAIARRILAEGGSQAAVILNAPNQREVFTYYYPDEPGITPLPDATPVKTAIRVAQENRTVYALFWGSEERDPRSKVENALQTWAFVLDTTWYGNVRLVTYVAPATPTDIIQTTSQATFGAPPMIALRGFNLSSHELKTGEALGVTLFWEALGKVEPRLKVFVHVYGSDGAIVAQHDGEPRGGLSPTTSWKPKTIIMDNHGLMLPADLTPGTYTLGIGLYSDSGDRLPSGAGDRVIIGQIVVMP